MWAARLTARLAPTISTVYEVLPAASQSAAPTSKSSVTEENVDGISTDAKALISAANSSNADQIAALKTKYGDDTKASTSI